MSGFDLDRIEGSGVYDISREEYRRENLFPCNFIMQPGGTYYEIQHAAQMARRAMEGKSGKI